MANMNGRIDLDDYKQRLKTLADQMSEDTKKRFKDLTIQPWTPKLPDRFISQLDQQLDNEMKIWDAENLPPNVHTRHETPLSLQVAGVFVLVASLLVLILRVYLWWRHRANGWLLLAIPAVVVSRRSASANSDRGESNPNFDAFPVGRAAMQPTTMPYHPGAHPVVSPSAKGPPEYPPSYDSDQSVHGTQAADCRQPPPPYQY